MLKARRIRTECFVCDTQKSYLGSPKGEKKVMKTELDRIEGEIERVHALHASRPQPTGSVTYLWPSDGTLGLRLEVRSN